MKLLSRVRLFATPWTVAYQVPPSMGFSRQEYWSGLPFPSPGDLPDPGIEPGSPAFQADALTSEPPGKPSSELGMSKSWLGLSVSCLTNRISVVAQGGPWASLQCSSGGTMAVAAKSISLSAGAVSGWTWGELWLLAVWGLPAGRVAI